MRSSAWSVIALLALTAAACAQGEEQGEEVPADTAAMGPAPAPMPMDTGMMQMDSAAHDSMMMQQPTTTQ